MSRAEIRESGNGGILRVSYNGEKVQFRLFFLAHLDDKFSNAVYFFSASF